MEKARQENISLALEKAESSPDSESVLLALEKFWSEVEVESGFKLPPEIERRLALVEEHLRNGDSIRNRGSGQAWQQYRQMVRKKVKEIRAKEKSPSS